MDSHGHGQWRVGFRSVQYNPHFSVHLVSRYKYGSNTIDGFYFKICIQYLSLPVLVLSSMNLRG